MNRLLIAIFLIVGLCSGSLAQAQYSTSRVSAPTVSASSQVVSTEPISQEKLISFSTQLDKEIERQADAFFAEFAKNNPSEPIGLWLKAKNIALLKWRQLHVATELVKSAGPAPAYALIAGEILSTFILPPIFTAMGMPALAAASVGIPWGAFAGAGVASWQMLQLKISIMRDLSVRSLSDLDRLRMELVGYEIKHRISSVIYTEVIGELQKTREFEVVSKLNASKDKLPKPAVDISDLELLVKSSGVSGQRFLEQIYIERANRALYSTKLLTFIMNNSQLSASLNDLLSSRATTNVAPYEQQRAREAMIYIDNLKKDIESAIRILSQESDSAKKKFKSGEYSRVEYEEVLVQKKANIRRLQELRLDLIRSEYHLLLDLKSAIAQASSVASLEVIEKFEATSLLEFKREILRSRTIVYDATGAPVARSLILSCKDLFAF